MTPREPDRFEAKARELLRDDCPHEGMRLAADCSVCLAAALRQAESSALDRAAQECDEHAEYFAAQRIRALIPPAAAPATPDAPTGPVCGCGKPSRYESGWCGETHCFNSAPAAETGKAQEAEALDGAALITTERKRQVEQEGWTPEHDDEHTDGALASAAACYAIYGHRKHPPSLWPWDKEWWRPGMDPIRRLVKAGALIAAEIDRLHREAEAKTYLAAHAAPPEGEGK